MTAPIAAPGAAPRLGLRQRKKIKLRRTIQVEALGLFAAHGYEQTTVEQIAEAAETSTTTFYRYFPTKEDVVLDDDYDSFIDAIAAARPRDESLAQTVRAAVAAAAEAGEADRDFTLARLRLIATVPALEARYAGEERKTEEMLIRFLAERTGRPQTDFQLALTASVVVAALFTATRRWARERGTSPLHAYTDQAVATVEPVLAQL